MKTIFAIGGGEIGRTGYDIETTAIDMEIIKSTGKNNPNLLFVPTASSDSMGYAEDVKNHFGGRLGCKVDVLYLLDNELDQVVIEQKISAADIVYVGGGNTRKMLEVWKEKGVDKILKEAWEKGIVISGISAGAVCWFKYFTSDSDKFTDGSENEYDLIKLEGLGWIEATFCPHYDKEEKRRPHLKEVMKSEEGIAVALENCAALMIRDDRYKVIRSKDSARAFKVYWKDGEYREEVIVVKDDFAELEKLLKI